MLRSDENKKPGEEGNKQPTKPRTSTSKAPRNKQKEEKSPNPAQRVEIKKEEAPRVEVKKEEAPKVEVKKEEAPKVEVKKEEAPKVEVKKEEAPRVEVMMVEAPKVELKKEEAPKVDVKKEEQQVINVDEKKDEQKVSKVEGKTDDQKTSKGEDKKEEVKQSKVEGKKEEQKGSKIEEKKEEQRVNNVEEKKDDDKKVSKVEGKKEEQPGSKTDVKSSCMERSDGLDALDKVEEKKLRPVEGYHGFLPREDLTSMVKNTGDYILRISETEGIGGDKARDLVLSVMGESTKEGTTTPMMRNMVIFKKNGKYYLNVKQQFDSLKDLLEFYKVNPWSHTGVNGKTMSFTVKTPIPLQKWEYTHKDVKIGKKLGVGAFGEVCGGRLRTKKSRMVDVAIKVAKKTENVSKEKMKELVNEARLVRNFKHINVVRTYGVAVDKQPLYIILELVSGGSLNNYLRSHVGETTEMDRLSMCLGAAKGMQYLHKYNTVHADVAARNCLISDEKVVKISDFGLSFVLGPGETWRMTPSTKLPIKWLAPETITQRQLSIKTDVYTFGVLCYEIFSDGQEPYHPMTNKEAKAVIPKGETLVIPGTCPEQMRSFLKERVFAMDAASRPMMPEVVYALQKSGAVDVEPSTKKAQ